MKRTNIYLKAKQLSLLKKAAKKVGVSMSQLIRQILDQYLTREA